MLLWKKIRELAIDTKITFPDGTSIDTKRIVAAGSARTLTTDDAGRIVKLDTAAGSTVTLPRSTGSGRRYKFVVTTLATSNSHIVKVGNTTDVLAGVVVLRDDTSDNAVAFATVSVAGADTVTLNRSTTGSVSLGEVLEFTDVAPGIYLVEGTLACTGTPATPFSATV